MGSSGTVHKKNNAFASKVPKQTAESLQLTWAAEAEAFLTSALNISLLSAVLWAACGVQSRSGFTAVPYSWFLLLDPEVLLRVWVVNPTTGCGLCQEWACGNGAPVRLEMLLYSSPSSAGV